MINILAEAERLHALGFAVHWLRAKSKVPYFGGWTKGGRATLSELKQTYKKGMNYGVRLGHASEIDGTFLAVIDVDVKSDKPHHRKEAEKALFKVFPEVKGTPFIHSGRGNGSAHYYVRLKHPVSGDECRADSKELVRVLMPSVPPSTAEEEQLSFDALAAGWRLRKAWEISLLSEGRQCVLAGSIHPDTGQPYVWGRGVAMGQDIPLINAGGQVTHLTNKAENGATETRKGTARGDGIKDWKFQDVALDTLSLSDIQIGAIKDGDGVTDASAKVYELVLAFLARGISDDIIVSVFTDKRFYLGQTAFKHARTNNRRYAAAWVDRYCIRKAKIKIGESDFDFDESEPSDKELRRERSGKKKPEPQPTEKVILWPVGLSQPPTDWEKQLELRSRGKLLAPLVRVSYTNILLILQNSCESATFLRLDEFSLTARYTCDTPWGIKKNQPRSSGDEDALLLKGWLHRKFEMVPSISLLEELLNSETIENKFHPVREYLNHAQNGWDGTRRIGTAFKDYFGARMPEPYLTEVTRKFFIGAVKRIFEPGSTFQYMVVLDGEQGIGKSTGISILASKSWFLDALPHLQDKDAALYLIGTWLCEIGELSALAKTDSGVAKAFISRDTDRIRPPYGKRRVDFPRSTVFIGTSNPRDYLTDPTGNRRYWPVHCEGRVDFEGLERDRDQLWAEAVTEYFFTQEKLFLQGRALKQSLVIQDLARAEDEIDIMLHHFREWEKDTIKSEGRISDRLEIPELFRSIWGSFKSDRASIMRAATVLRQLGYDKRKIRGKYFWKKQTKNERGDT